LWSDWAAISQKRGEPAALHRGGYSTFEIAYQRYFFGFWIFSVCFTTKDFKRANSFLEPFAKSRGPYSKSTTKQKARTMNKTSQKSPRSNAMVDRLTCSNERVNGRGESLDKFAAVRHVADKSLFGRHSLLAAANPSRVEEVYLP